LVDVRSVLQSIRRRVLAKRSAPVRPLILMYHRVAAVSADPWGLAVHPDRFEAHLAVLARHRTPMRMSELVRALNAGTLPHDAVAVTFDDGYVDNLHHAKPRLAAAGIPATVFLMAGAIGQRTEFWWDEVARGILGRPGSGSDWRAWQSPPSDAEAEYLRVWRELRDATPPERDARMRRFREAVNDSPPRAGDLPMNTAEVAELCADGLVEIGGHTVTHPVLPLLDPVERRREIRAGKESCERLAGTAIEGFAYPHGAMDADTRAAVAECGFSWACSTESISVPSKDVDCFALPRVFVPDCDARAFERTLEAATRIEAAS
jgi:peptidoglycan/xylan/chitin deacetylase (PgdA/CDA1 family)